MQQENIVFHDLIQRMTLMDDIFMSQCFKNIPCVELVLKIILNRDDIRVKSVKTQENIKGFGRSLILDILAEDYQGRKMNIEIQRNDEGADIRRARFHSSVLDYVSLKARSKFKELCDNYVIFITEHDVLKRGLPLYTITRHIEETGETFNDGSHIIYVNASCRDAGTALGRLMLDMTQPDPDKMYYNELASSARSFKDIEQGDKKMYGVMEEFVQRKIKDTQNEIITRMLQDGSLSFNKIAKYLKVSLRQVKSVARALNITEK